MLHTTDIKCLYCRNSSSQLESSYVDQQDNNNIDDILYRAGVSNSLSGFHGAISAPPSTALSCWAMKWPIQRSDTAERVARKEPNYHADHPFNGAASAKTLRRCDGEEQWKPQKARNDTGKGTDWPSAGTVNAFWPAAILIPLTKSIWFNLEPSQR